MDLDDCRVHYRAVLCSALQCIVMEKIIGQNLEEITKVLNSEQRSAIWRALCDAVKVMQGKGFVHGDLRRPNIIRDNEIEPTSPTPVIVDFGWAGIENQVNYPYNINPIAYWASGVHGADPILSQHDLHMAENIFYGV